VARGSLDRLVGIVRVRDILAAVRRRNAATVGEIARPAMVVPETKDLGALLRNMREQREQLAVVIDEYGLVAGIVTVEDLLEELVGDIQDEFDLPDARLTWLDDRTVRVAGSMTIDDFNETVGTRLPQRGPRTLAGLVFETLGRGPAVGDAVTVDDVRLTRPGNRRPPHHPDPSRPSHRRPANPAGRSGRRGRARAYARPAARRAPWRRLERALSAALPPASRPAG
jgi:putative hemolysin